MTAVPESILAAMGAEPTPEQWAAILMPLEPYVVVAGAGSGKTSVIAARVVYLALVASGRIHAEHVGVFPGDVLCLTFTNKATEHLTLTIRRALATIELPEGEEPTVLNYHGFAQHVLDRYGLLAGIEPGQRVLTPAQRSELCGQVLDEIAFEHVPAEWQPSVIVKILSLADQLANHRREPADVIAFCEARLPELSKHRGEAAYRSALERVELARAVERFRERKRELGVIDFGDQITLALNVIEGHPEVVREYRAHFGAVVLDEYQDTNVAQADLIAGAFGDGFPVTAVGDPDQSIYAWRGASLFNLLEFQEQFRRADGSAARKLPLYTNFRSGASILAAADTVIAPIPSAQRPDPDKTLAPWAANGEGLVEVRRFADEWTEARWIAARAATLHEEDPAANPWSSFAVLARKSRLFVSLQEAFGELGIPVEIVGLAGLLKMPEVVEVLSYAKAVADPFASVSIARILLGPRYRVGPNDLARVASWARHRNKRGPDEDDDRDRAPFLFAEALEHLDGVTALSDEGRSRLTECRDELARLRGRAAKPLGEFLAEVMRTTGLLAELDASPDAERARATRRNLAAFLAEVHAFAPLEGELTLRSFLDYVSVMESLDREEWAPVQPSAEDSVKVMTIHQAKGLEFDTVFVPGLATDLLPDLQVQQNPAERGYSLDFELRGDRRILPTFRGNFRQFWLSLRKQEELEERRTAYVGLTRARRRLCVTGAHWYGEGLSPKKPSPFLDELAAWGTETGRAEVGPDAGSPQTNPLLGYRERFVRDWPGRALRDEGDPLFPNGWRAAAAAEAANGGTVAAAVSALDPAEQLDFASQAEERRTVAAQLMEREDRMRRDRPAVPSTVSVAGLIDYATCPKRFYWAAVRPLPRFSGPAARIGTQVHAWIERKGSGQASLLELEEAPDLTAEELVGQPGKVERLQRNFLASRFAQIVPLYAERQFLLYLDGVVVKGRIDAIFGEPGGPWEVVDYKTGRMPAADDDFAGLQLDLYALACTEVFGKRAEDVRLTYFYVDAGEEVSRVADPPGEMRERVRAWLQGIRDGRFDPESGPQCRHCDFLSFCDAGRAFMAAQEPRA